MLHLSHRAQQLQPSATLAQAAKAKALKARGVHVIDFTVGEPDFDTPSYIKEAAKAALDAGFTKYTQTGGIPELKEAIRAKLKRDQGVDYAADEIIVTCGAKQAIANSLLALIDAGDEVLIPAPYWVSYPEQVKLAGGIPRIIPTNSTYNFLLTEDDLVQAITTKTRALILNSPSNPTGSAYDAEHLKKIVTMAAEQGLAIISDEIYEKLLYDGRRHASVVDACDAQAREQIILINGVSKAFAMTGWRMGYAAGPKHVIAKMQALQDQQTSCITSFVQKASVAALAGSHDELQNMVAEFEARRDLMLRLLGGIDGITCTKPHGAFFIFPNVSGYLGKSTGGKTKATSDELADYLLDSVHVAAVSGEPFGAPGFLRFSYATSRENIEEGMRRIKEALMEVTSL